MEISDYAGPREWDDGWAKHWNLAANVQPQVDVPWDSSASWEATVLYSRFSWAVESYFLATNPDADEKHHGRASKITVKEEEATFDNDFTHIYATPACSFWEHLGDKIS